MADLAPILYDPYRVPPAIRVALPTVAPASTESFVEQMHALVTERKGATWYYPSEKETRCRYEWHRRWRRREFALRLGLMFVVGVNGLATQLEAYVADSRVFADDSVGLPDLSPRELRRIERHFRGTIELVVSRTHVPASRNFEVLYFQKPPAGCLVQDTFVDGDLRLFPTKLVSSHLTSPMGLTVEASGLPMAQAYAAPLAQMTCALLSLATGQAYGLGAPPWPKNARCPETIASGASAESLYPPSARPVASGFENQDPVPPLRWLREALSALPETSVPRFTNAVFAYYSALEQETDRGSLACVAFVAALSSLARPNRSSCAGGVSCTECGTLPRHSKVGETAAVIKLVTELLSVAENDAEQASQLLKRVYRSQRSAFVHAAELRHEEAQQGHNMPICLPTNREPQREAYHFRRDLMALKEVVRAVLIRWLGKESGKETDDDLLRLRPPRFNLHFRYITTGTVFANRWTRMTPGLED